MNRFLHLLICLVISLPLWGQISISVTPGIFVLDGHPSSSDVNIHIDVVNNSPSTVSLLWSRTITGAPAEWESWICDKNLCYLPIANACSPSKPNELAPGQHMDFQIHVDPNTVEGTIGYEVLFQNFANPDEVLGQIVGEVNINSTVSTSDDKGSAKFTVFPNPATEYFQVSDLADLNRIELFNIVGSKVKSYSAAPQKQYSVSDLNEGIYLVRLISSENKVIKTVRLSVK